MTQSVDWLGKPIPPSRLQALLKDDPFARAYVAACGARFPEGLARSFEDNLRSRLRVPVRTEEDVVGFLRGCLYASDEELFARPEVWLHPEDFERLGAGDCEDHALWAWVQLVRLGRDARFTAGLHRERGHAWVTILKEGAVTICETTARKTDRYWIGAGDAHAYLPVWSVNGEARFYWHGPLEEGVPGIEFLE